MDIQASLQSFLSILEAFTEEEKIAIGFVLLYSHVSVFMADCMAKLLIRFFKRFSKLIYYLYKKERMNGFYMQHIKELMKR